MHSYLTVCLRANALHDFDSRRIKREKYKVPAATDEGRRNLASSELIEGDQVSFFSPLQYDSRPNRRSGFDDEEFCRPTFAAIGQSDCESLWHAKTSLDRPDVDRYILGPIVSVRRLGSPNWEAIHRFPRWRQVELGQQSVIEIADDS